MNYYADLHVHIGGTRQGYPVKITASRALTFEAILQECRNRKGIDIVGIVDCASMNVLLDIEYLFGTGDLVEQTGGGWKYHDELVIFPAAEVEISVGLGNCHFVSYFGTLNAIKEFADRLNRVMTNSTLSSQKAQIEVAELSELTRGLGGQLFAAHAFTPHKGLVGRCISNPELELPGLLDGIELGLSADTDLADRVPGIAGLPFLSNSDAHSCQKIAREYNVLELKVPTFEGFVNALKGREGCRITANYGMNPILGKYHRTFCLKCEQTAQAPPPILQCTYCGSEKVVQGVLDRIISIGREESVHPAGRPPYYYHVPLEFVPGVGPKTLAKLITVFGSEMAVLHKASRSDLQSVVGAKIADMIVAARLGKLELTSGGGGIYGKVR